jgi:hypothetical protein
MLTFALIVAAIFQIPAQAQGKFTYEDLVALVKSKGVQSVDQLIPLLPDELRSNFTFMYQSMSLQEATAKAPRAILFLRDGTLTCTFNGNPSEKGYDTLECFQYRAGSRSFDFRQIEFPSPRNGLRVVEFSRPNHSANGAISCTSCHGRDPRPNWEAYPGWPGAYGSNNDILGTTFPDQKVQAETRNFLQFKSTYKKYPRYAALKFPTSDQLSPYFEGEIGLGVKVNNHFSAAVAVLNAHRDARLLESLPRWRQYLFLMAISGCPVTAEDQASYPQFLQRPQLAIPVPDSVSHYYKQFHSLDTGSPDQPNRKVRTVFAALADSIPPAEWTPFFRSLGLLCADCVGTGITPPLKSEILYPVEGSAPWTFDYDAGIGAKMNHYVATEVIAHLVSTGDLDLEPYDLPVTNYLNQQESNAAEETGYKNPNSIKDIDDSIDSQGSPFNTQKSFLACELMDSKFKAAYAAQRPNLNFSNDTQTSSGSSTKNSTLAPQPVSSPAQSNANLAN